MGEVEEIVYCVMGCTARCRDEACAVVGFHDHDPIRRRAAVDELARMRVEEGL